MQDKDTGTPKHVGVWVHKLDLSIKKELDNEIDRLGGTEGNRMYAWILRFLSENKDRIIFQRDVEKHFSIGRSTVTGLLQEMEQEGLVSRENVENDARCKRVLLTPLGERTNQMHMQNIERFNKELTRGIPEDELECFFAVVQKLMVNLERNAENNPDGIQKEDRK